jgi:lysozyme
MAKKKTIKNKTKFVGLLLTAFLVTLLLLAVIYRNPTVYYAKKTYHAIGGLFKGKDTNKALEATNLNGDVFVPQGNVFGIDISRHQGKIDWIKLKEFRFQFHKFDFVYIKATESTDWIDKYFKENWKSAKVHGFVRGAYHFFDPHESVETQMKHFFKTVKIQKGDLPPMLDVEQISRISTADYQEMVKKCLELMEEHYQMKPFLYINQDFYDTYFSTADFVTYPMWISRLKTTPPSQENWLIWQFCHTAVVPGISEFVDVNVFNGSQADFNILLK